MIDPPPDLTTLAPPRNGVPGPGRVDRDGVPPHLVGPLVPCGYEAGRGVGHHHVDLAQLPRTLRHGPRARTGPGCRAGVASGSRDRSADLARDDVGTVAGQRDGMAALLAARCAGDERDLALDSTGHDGSPHRRIGDGPATSPPTYGRSRPTNEHLANVYQT
jgi:hypothetical protein